MARAPEARLRNRITSSRAYSLPPQPGLISAWLLVLLTLHLAPHATCRPVLLILLAAHPMPSMQIPKMCILLLMPIGLMMLFFMPYLMFFIGILILTYFFIFL